MDNEQNAKQVIIDLVNRIKYTVTPEQMAELSGSAAPIGKAEFVDWHARIDNLDLTSGGDCPWLRGEMVAQLREVLRRIAGRTVKIGGRVVPIGRRIVKWLFSLVESYPNTALAVVLVAGLAFLASSVPLIGQLLFSIVQVAAIGIVGIVFLNESLLNHRIAVQVVRYAR